MKGAKPYQKPITTYYQAFLHDDYEPYVQSAQSMLRLIALLEAPTFPHLHGYIAHNNLLLTLPGEERSIAVVADKETFRFEYPLEGTDNCSWGEAFVQFDTIDASDAATIIREFLQGTPGYVPHARYSGEHPQSVDAMAFHIHIMTVSEETLQTYYQQALDHPFILYRDVAAKMLPLISLLDTHNGIPFWGLATPLYLTLRQTATDYQGVRIYAYRLGYSICCPTVIPTRPVYADQSWLVWKTDNVEIAAKRALWALRELYGDVQV
jgi:hypothetical protein